MPKYNNSFRTPAFHEETIVNEDNAVVGTLRIKPSSILWKPKGAQKFLSVPLDKFAEWIADPATKARKTGS